MNNEEITLKARLAELSEIIHDKSLPDSERIAAAREHCDEVGIKIRLDLVSARIKLDQAILSLDFQELQESTKRFEALMEEQDQ